MLTATLVDRLLASTLVPREAKVAAIESWRRELASAPVQDALHRQLEQRLAEASRLLAAPQACFAAARPSSGDCRADHP
jgi:hypothetical protein